MGFLSSYFYHPVKYAKCASFAFLYLRPQFLGILEVNCQLQYLVKESSPNIARGCKINSSPIELDTFLSAAEDSGNSCQKTLHTIYSLLRKPFQCQANMCLIDRIQKPALYFVDYSFMIGGIIIQGHVYAKYNVSISSRTIVSGYTNYKSNNPAT